MTSTSDELRNWCGRPASYKELLALADRIDAETVELPRDRDGVPIHVGDTVYLDDGRKAEVRRIQISERENSIGFTVCGDFFALWPEDFTHTAPDSWERIADELDEQAGSITKDGCTWQEDAIHDFADRIRRLAERED
jgi:hypothetical protein